MFDIPVEETGALFATSRLPTRDEEDTAQRALDLAASSGFPPVLVVERGYQDDTTLALLVLLGVAGVVALGATAIAVGLAAADGRPDLATLAAIGAAPRTRRLLASSQALVIAGLGTLLGIVAGFVPGIAAVRSQTDWSVPFTGVGSHRAARCHPVGEPRAAAHRRTATRRGLRRVVQPVAAADGAEVDMRTPR